MPYVCGLGSTPLNALTTMWDLVWHMKALQKKNQGRVARMIPPFPDLVTSKQYMEGKRGREEGKILTQMHESDKSCCNQEKEVNEYTVGQPCIIHQQPPSKFSKSGKREFSTTSLHMHLELSMVEQEKTPTHLAHQSAFLWLCHYS